jgi:hypothetical protein
MSGEAGNTWRSASLVMRTLAQFALKLKTVVDCVSIGIPPSRAGL